MTLAELDRKAWRRLDPELRLIDTRLQLGAPWARPSFRQLGYPTRSVTERAREGGLLARTPGAPPPREWPQPVVEVDRAVAQLPLRQQAAVMAQYFHAEEAAEQRAAIYLKVARHLAAARAGALQGVRTSEPQGGVRFGKTWTAVDGA